VTGMYNKSLYRHIKMLLCLLLMVLFSDVSAATRQQCRRSMVVTEVQQLNFGNYEGTIVGTITVDTNGVRSSTGPVLAGGTVSSGVYEVSSTIDDCNVYPVVIRYMGNPTLTGTGAPMSINTFTSNPASPFTISPLANVPTPVYIGGTLDSSAAQTEGAYTGTYRVRFTHRNP
jgi:hypothetical protein